jgi:hypothetical protein
MTKTVYATFDGEVLRLEEPLGLAPNSRVRVTVEAGDASAPPPKSFLDVVQGLELDGPSHLSTRLHEYLYGDDEGR